MPRGPPHSEPTLRRAPYHPEDILGPLTRLLRCVLLAFGFEDPDGTHSLPGRYFMHFAMWRGQTLETCPPSKDISWSAPAPDLDSAMADLRHPSAKSQPLLLCNHLPHHPSGEDNRRAQDQAEPLGGMARPAVILPTRCRDLSPTVSTHLSTRS